MENEDPVSVYNTFGLDKSCPDGIFYQGKCDKDGYLEFAAPKTEATYYTTWSFVLIVVSLLLAIVICIWSRAHKKHAITGWRSNLFKYVLCPLAILGASNSIGVFVVSQLILGNFFQSDVHVSKDNKDPSISLSFMQDVNFWNNIVHLLPVVISFIILFLLSASTWPTSTKTHKVPPRIRTFLIALSIAIVFILVYLSVPYIDDNGDKHYFLDKLRYVYGANTSAWIYPIGMVVVIAACFMTSYFGIK